MHKPDRQLGPTTIRNVIPWQRDRHRAAVSRARHGRCRTEGLTWSSSSGSPRVDAESDFMRARRHQVLSALAARLRNDTDDVVQSMSFDEVVEALGRRAENYLGTKVIPLDAIVGSVDKVRDFDRRFRPTSGRSRQRWERLVPRQPDRRGHPADRRLPGRRLLLRPRRPPPRLGRAQSRPRRHRGPRHGDRHVPHAGRHRRPLRPRAQVLAAAHARARPVHGRGTGGRGRRRPVRLRRHRRDRRGLGGPHDARRGRRTWTRRRWRRAGTPRSSSRSST